MNTVLCALVAVLVVVMLQGCALKFGVPRFWIDNPSGPDRCDSGPLIRR